MSRKVILVAAVTAVLLLGCGSTNPVVQSTNPPSSPPLINCIAVILNSTNAQTTYQGNDPASSTDVFLVVDVSFQNNCPTSMTLSPSWDLKDATGNHFSPVDPPAPIVRDVSESNQQTTGFEVPSAEGCNFTLYLIGVQATQSWTLNCGQ